MWTLTRLAGVTLLASATAAPLPAAETAGVSIRVGPSSIDFLAGGKLVTRYHTGAELAKPYFWPVLGPGDLPLTRAWPIRQGVPGETRDHVHQKSAWFCHGDVIPEGVELKDRIKGVEGVDFWSEAKGHGRIVVTETGTPKTDGNDGRVTTRNVWRTADGIKVLDETRTIHLYDLGETRLIVLDIDLHASASPITFGDTKEGSLGVRINDAIREAGGGKGRLENAEGKVGEKQVWGQVSKWCDYSGPLSKAGGRGEIDGVERSEPRKVGLAILDDPKNPVPACWHSRGYGLMAANPFGRKRSGFPAMRDKSPQDLVRLAKGEHLKLRYGLLLHPGDAKEGKVAEYYEKFIKLGSGADR